MSEKEKHVVFFNDVTLSLQGIAFWLVPFSHPNTNSPPLGKKTYGLFDLVGKICDATHGQVIETWLFGKFLGEEPWDPGRWCRISQGMPLHMICGCSHIDQFFRTKPTRNDSLKLLDFRVPIVP